MSSLLATSLSAQTVISDSTFSPGDWSVQVVSEFGGTESHEQRLAGGNPGAYRYMKHTLPVPPGINDLTRIEVTHIFEGDVFLALDDIDHIDYSEDIRLLNLSWAQAFIVSYPAIRQSERLFRANDFLSVIGNTQWTSGSLAGLTANDFFALDGSGEHPDFSSGGDFLYFGFWRISTRGATLPPIPSNQDLIYEHGSDNFTVTIHEQPPANQPPVARGDESLYLDYFMNSPSVIPVIENDSDPEGDPIRVFSVDEPAFGGAIVSFDDNTITYSLEEPLRLESESDFFVYTITDGEDESAPAFVNIYFCVCPIECISLFLAPPSNSEPTAKHTGSASAADTLDVELFRRFRDEVLLPTETGARFVDLYYRNAEEVMPLMVFDRPELGLQALRALQMIQEPVRDLVEAGGSMTISQVLIDSVGAFLDSLNLAVSDSLRDSLDAELVRLGPLQDLAGLSVAEAVEQAIEDSITTIVEENIFMPDKFSLEQNFPNPFNPSTTLRYSVGRTQHVSLIVYDVRGREVATLVHEKQGPGEYTVPFDGTGLASGIYVYRLRTERFTQTRKMLLLQ